ncbi:uncharacterized protein LOC126907875 [Daktulosphaira vitifoliae]|uniref:uncharacterized protein LOC126907875 n=1 Tax=Daktulosphaira vitifoliae TaxID=58002 RepID=UPI0021AA07B7|nr:uncharacterized protein LOC126907875 [Daktulosphaira vitifoliae]XP_050545480.1 uncharacterized protein LOC126907875 [Daktulosphaira vitifoliae]XP_050545481.1 uncharacterized protein LOC126907875 [Daktulosphaira vitifoliae]
MMKNYDHRLKGRLEKIQYQYFNGRPKWTTVQLRDLNLYIAYTCMGSPFENENKIEEILVETNNESSELFSYYSSEKQNQVKIIVNTIKKKIIDDKVEDIDVGVTLVHSVCKDVCEICQKFPDKDIHLWIILRIKINKRKFFYYDVSLGRTYKDWNSYLKNNTLPKGYMFYPKTGFYDEADYLIKDLTPSSKPSAKLLNCLDIVGKVTSFTSGTLLAGSLFLPIMAPITLPAAAVATSSSIWDIGRQISNLFDRNSHNQSLSDAVARKHWLDLTISMMGVMTAPLSAGVKTLELSGSSLLASRFGKTLLILRTSTCITQCSLSIVGLTSDIIDGISMKKLILSFLTYLRLDVFLVTGVLFALPINRIIQNIFESVTERTTLSKEIIYQNIFHKNSIPYCIVQKYFNDCMNFTKKHINEFCEQIQKFFKNELTFEKLMIALNDIIQVYEECKKNMVKENSSLDELLNYVINHMDLDFLTLREKEEAISILGGENMKKFLLCVPKEYLNKKMIIFCINQVLSKANYLALEFTNVVQTCMLYNETDTVEITHSFCSIYNLEECCLKEYLLYGIRILKNDIQDLLSHFSEYEKKNYEDFKVDFEGFTNKIKMYQMIAPHNNLDFDTCKRISQVLIPRQDGYNNFLHKAFEENSCLLYINTEVCKKTVFFNINSNGDINQLYILFV